MAKMIIVDEMAQKKILTVLKDLDCKADFIREIKLLENRVEVIFGESWGDLGSKSFSESRFEEIIGE